MCLKIVVLVSGIHGRGSNLQALARACGEGKINGRIVGVIGNHAASPALERARSLNIETQVVQSPKKSMAETEAETYSFDLSRAIQEFQPDLICLAGYLIKIPDGVVERYSGRIMNIHNALLPSFGGKGMYGLHVHQAVVDYGVKISGCTVHFVDAGYDTGPIILQRTVSVSQGDTAESVAKKVLVEEHKAYPEAVALFCAGRLNLRGRIVDISEPNTP